MEWTQTFEHHCIYIFFVFFIFLPAPAKISETIPSKGVTAYVGGELTLECFVEGNPSPTVTLDRTHTPLGMTYLSQNHQIFFRFFCTNTLVLLNFSLTFACSYCQRTLHKRIQMPLKRKDFTQFFTRRLLNNLGDALEYIYREYFSREYFYSYYRI